ncbi:hypothetical protein PSP6_750006 [Paraburkholderia tropica]|uniref:hypothetical protein n=1 Tax=Paraburkholderia tropica TaxID=92647 RepID=UPI001CAF075F|nr:hypothetical protein [Paraburkholderia tropica]CAG9237764.1 hypothetical protein PSP6_750006 [Paraburkholderia tropica]
MEKTRIEHAASTVNKGERVAHPVAMIAVPTVQFFLFAVTLLAFGFTVGVSAIGNSARLDSGAVAIGLGCVLVSAFLLFKKSKRL